MLHRIADPCPGSAKKPQAGLSIRSPQKNWILLERVKLDSIYIVEDFRDTTVCPIRQKYTLKIDKCFLEIGGLEM
jgi:hypothetical protein